MVRPVLCVHNGYGSVVYVRLYERCACSTYYVAFDEPVPGVVPGVSNPESERRRRAVSYYQWVPFVLLSQALLSAAPHVLWTFASRRAGLNVASVIDASQSYQKAMYAEPRDHALRYLVAQVPPHIDLP